MSRPTPRDLDEGLAPDASAPRRPRGGVFALVLVLVLGATSWTEGCARLAIYRAQHDPTAMLHASIEDAGERARVEALYREFVDTTHAARSRGAPLAAATFVLGAALVVLASRTLGRRQGGRSALVQVVAANAIVATMSFAALPDVRAAELRRKQERRGALDRDEPPRSLAPVLAARRSFEGEIALGLRLLGSLFVLFALTRPKARDFLDVEGAPTSDA